MSVYAALAELKEKLATKPDYITLNGSGEPTLFCPLDELIAGIRSMTDTASRLRKAQIWCG